jgi:hypothetical protein
MNEKRTRNSNLELVRILCIIAIIADHYTGQGYLSELGNPAVNFFYAACDSLSRVACSVFFIITAWFTVGTPFRSRRVLHVWLTGFCYSLVLTLICMFRLRNISGFDLYSAFFPLEQDMLWFVNCYVLLMLFSPFLNLLFRPENRRITEFLLILFGFLMILYTTAGNDRFQFGYGPVVEIGFFANEIWVAMYIYVLTGYLKTYLKKLPSGKKVLLLFLGLWLALTVYRAAFEPYESLRSGILQTLYDYGETYRSRMRTLPNLVMAYSIFFFAVQTKEKSVPVIDRLAGTALGVYCFHQVPVWREYLFNTVCRGDYLREQVHGLHRMLWVAAMICAIWVAGTVIELLRNAVCGVLIENRGFYKKLCDGIDGFVAGEIPMSPAVLRRIAVAAVIFALYVILLKYTLC